MTGVLYLIARRPSRPSPVCGADDRQRRMNYQVQRLASRMRDRAAASPEAELAVMLTAWFAQTPQRDALESRFLRAADAAVASLP